MAIKIDLLPAESKIKGGYLKAAKLAKSINLIFFSAFLVIGLLLAIYVVFLSVMLKNTKRDNDFLISEIKKYQTSEQKIVLLKDRLSKIKTLLKLDTASDLLNKIKPIMGQLTQDATITNLKIQPEGASVSMVFKTSGAFGQFLSSQEEGKFKSLTIDTVSFNPAIGFLVNLTIKK